MGIPLHLLQQPECLSALSLPSLIQPWFHHSLFVPFEVFLFFDNWCLCSSWVYVHVNRIMHSFLNLNMIRYEIQEFLLSNLNYVNYEQRYLIRGKSCSAGHYNAHSLRKKNVCDQLQHHTRFSIRGVCDESRLRTRSGKKERVRLMTPAFVLVSLSHTIWYRELFMMCTESQTVHDYKACMIRGLSHTFSSTMTVCDMI